MGGAAQFGGDFGAEGGEVDEGGLRLGLVERNGEDEAAAGQQAVAEFRQSGPEGRHVLQKILRDGEMEAGFGAGAGEIAQGGGFARHFGEAGIGWTGGAEEEQARPGQQAAGLDQVDGGAGAGDETVRAGAGIGFAPVGDDPAVPQTVAIGGGGVGGGAQAGGAGAGANEGWVPRGEGLLVGEAGIQQRLMGFQIVQKFGAAGEADGGEGRGEGEGGGLKGRGGDDGGLEGHGGRMAGGGAGCLAV